MELVPGFLALFNGLAPAMTAPSFVSFTTVIAGWVLARRRTITGIIEAAGEGADKHFSSYHRLFSAARWSLDALGMCVLILIESFLDAGVVMLALDDTLTRKRGLKVFGSGMHYDPLCSSKQRVTTNWGLNWVVLGVLIEFPFRPGHTYCLPILFRLYLNPKSAAKHRRVYRSRSELALQMLQLLCSRRKHSHFHVVADSAYGGQIVGSGLPENCDLTSRFTMNSRLYAAAPARDAKKIGRPRVRGEKLPTPKEMLAQRCRQVTLDVYGRHQTSRVAEQLAHTYALPDRPIRVVAIAPIKGQGDSLALFTTGLDSTAEDTITRFARRWSIEVTNHDTKQHLGFEDPQSWTAQAVQRTAPIAMLLYTLIVLWFAREGHTHWQPPTRPWYPQKTAPSFPDMLRTLRQLSVQHHISKWALAGPGSRKVKQLLANLMALST